MLKWLTFFGPWPHRILRITWLFYHLLQKSLCKLSKLFSISSKISNFFDSIVQTKGFNTKVCFKEGWKYTIGSQQKIFKRKPCTVFPHIVSVNSVLPWIVAVVKSQFKWKIWNNWIGFPNSEKNKNYMRKYIIWKRLN